MSESHALYKSTTTLMNDLAVCYSSWIFKHCENLLNGDAQISYRQLSLRSSISELGSFILWDGRVALSLWF